MNDPRELLVKIAKILDHLRIDYMVTGGMAVFVWGRPRFTADIDIVVELAPPDVKKLARELRGIDDAGYVDEVAMRDALQRHGEFNFISPEMGLKVDFWILGRESHDHNELKRKKRKKILEYDVAFISPEDLILRKIRWYNKSMSEKHLEDARTVVAISGKKLDYTYLRRAAASQGLANGLDALDIHEE